MRSVRGYVILKYDKGHMRKAKLGAIQIEIAREVNNDLKEGHDQRAVVVGVSDSCKWLTQGDTVWTHYLGSDKGNSFEHEGETYHRIRESQIFFKINEDGSFEMADGVYLGKEVISEAPKTESGIYLTPYDDEKELLKIKVTNVPDSQDYIKEGNTVMSCDGNQYLINYEGETFIKIDEVYIVGVYGEELT
jgi:hypothetical protein